MDNDFCKCTNMDLRTFINFVLDYHKQLDENIVLFINEVNKDYYSNSVIASIFTRESSSDANQPYSVYDIVFTDDTKSQTHSAHIKFIASPERINISDSWNDFLEQQNPQKINQSAETQLE